MTWEGKDTGASEVPEPHSLTARSPTLCLQRPISIMLPVTVSIKTPDTIWWGPSVQSYPLAKIATVFVGRRTIALPLVNPPEESNVTYFSTHLLPNWPRWINDVP